MAAASAVAHSQDTDWATEEPGEPKPCADVGRTVWYAYTADSQGTLTADTFGGEPLVATLALTAVIPMLAVIPIGRLWRRR